jgi:hypothetical protein
MERSGGQGDTEKAVDAGSMQHLNGRGAPRLLEHCAVLDRVTGGEGPSARARLELELGDDLATFLIGALSRPARGRPVSAVA